MGSGAKVRCDECPTPVAERRGDRILIRQRHHGHEHVTLLPIRDLLEEAEKEEKETRLIRIRDEG
jgi:hypothetical protein